MLRHRERNGEAYAATASRRRTMVPYRALITQETSPQAQHRTAAPVRPACAGRNTVCSAIGHSVGNASQGNGLRLRHDLLATVKALATSPRLEPSAPDLAEQVARGRETGFLPCDSRQFLDSCRGGGKKSGPNPTDRRRAGSKHHLLTDAQGIPLSVILTKANRHDVT